MSKLPWNKFLNEHANFSCVHIGSPDYKAGLTEIATGKVLPSPNALTGAIGRLAPGNFSVRSLFKGQVQILCLSDIAAARAIASRTGGQLTSTQLKGCTEAFALTLDLAQHTAIAKQLGLM